MLEVDARLARRLRRCGRNDSQGVVIARRAARKQAAWGLSAVFLISFTLCAMAAAVSWSRLAEPWPDPASLVDIPGVPVSWPSTSPFAPEAIGGGPDNAPLTAAQGRLYLPPGPQAA